MGIVIGYLAICFLLTYGNRNHPKVNIIIIFLLGVFINGYRSVSFTTDNVAYAEYFINNSKLSLAESWSSVLTQYGKDPFYYFVGNVFSKLGFTYRGWFIFIAIIYMGGFCYLLYKYSCDYFISMLFFISQSYFYFSMTGLRQTIAMGICFFAFDFAVRKKIVPFLMLIFLASLFHSSALIFIVFYITKNVKSNAIQWGITVLAVAISVFSPNFINKLVELFAWNDNLSSYAEVSTGLSISGFVIQLCVLLFCILFTKHDYEYVEARRPWINILFLGLLFQSFVINIDNIFRMSMYFSVYGAIMVPEVINLQGESNRRILYIAVPLSLILYLFRSGGWSRFTLFGGL